MKLRDLEQENARLRAALEAEVRRCHVCRGSGVYTPPCSLCDDSTEDHVCDDEGKPCFRCVDARAALAPAQPAQEPPAASECSCRPPLMYGAHSGECWKCGRSRPILPAEREPERQCRCKNPQPVCLSWCGFGKHYLCLTCGHARACHAPAGERPTKCKCSSKGQPICDNPDMGAFECLNCAHDLECHKKEG